MQDGGVSSETLFPVCISCVFNVKLRARACFLCVMGARPQDPDTKTTHHKSPPMSVTGQAAGIHIRTVSQAPVYRLRAATFTKCSS